MTSRLSILSLASAATLALALAQPVAAEGEQAAPQAAAAASGPAIGPAAGAPAAPPATETPPAPPAAAAAEAALQGPPPAAGAMSPHAAAMERLDQRRAEMDAERNQRYEELRQRAAEVGIELPETPPWQQTDMPRPEMPAMPSDLSPPAMSGMTPGEREAARAAQYQSMRERAKAHGIELPETPPHKLMTPEERRAQMERMRNLTPEERMAARAENYKALRERAAAQGIDLPETPPWEQAQQRRKAMQEKWDSYRKQVDAMTEEQREAARAVFGSAPGVEGPQMPMQRPMPMDMPPDMPMGRPMDMPGPGQGSRGFGGPCPQADCGGMMPPRGMMPGWGGDQGYDQTFPQPQEGYGAPWGRGY
jgi:hypothetical protein